MNFLYLMIASLFVITSNSGLSDTASDKFELEVSNTFFTDGVLSDQKIDKFYANVKKAQEDNYQLLINYYTTLGGDSEKKARKKAENKNSNVAYERIDELISLMRTSPPEIAKEIARSVLDISFALKTEGRDELYEHEFDSVRGIIRPYSVRKKNKKDPEPSNLVDPKTGEIVSQKQATLMKAQGVDLSRYNPRSDGQLWTNHDIENYKINSTYLPSSNLYKGLDIAFPEDGATVNFHEIKRSQNRPKFSVKAKVGGEKRKYKVKINLEINGEPTAAALFSALGFNTDASKYVRDLKVRFKDNEKRIFLRDFAEYFQLFDIKHSVKYEGRDEKGEFIVFKNALLEARQDDILRIGPWGWSSNANPSKREIRAIALLNVWVGNYDLKESAQNRLLLRRGGDPERRYFISSDLGWVFGSYIEPERVGSWPWNPILKKWGKSIRFNYYGAKYTKALSETTWDDAKWTVRLISRLTRDQISDAVRLGGWPKSVGALLTEKLISRRNELVKAFDLEKEAGLIPYDRNLTTSDGVVKNGKLKRSTFGGYSKKYGNQLAEILDPTIYGHETSFIARIMDRTLKPSDEISYSGTAFDDFPWVGGPRVSWRRKVKHNDEPQGASDKYLVHDQLVLGFSLYTGKGNVSGEARYYRVFNLIHPASSKRRGLYSYKYLPALFLPYLNHFPLPEKYALYVEDFVEGGGTISLAGNPVIDLGPSASVSRVSIKRQLFTDKSNGEINAFEDHSAYSQLSFRLRAQFAQYDFPFFAWLGKRGEIKRDLYKIKVDAKEDTRDRLNYAISEFFPKSGEVSNIVETKTLDANFVSKEWGFNLFDYVFSRRKSERHHVLEYDKSGSLTNESYQLEKIVEEKWNMPVLTNSNEDHYGKAFYYSLIKEDGSHENSIMGLNFKVKDSHTSSKEIEQEYIPFANIAAKDDDFLPFKASLFNHRRNWGTTLFFLDFLVYDSGIKKLLELSNEDFEIMTGTSYQLPPMTARERSQNQEDSETKATRRLFYNIYKAKNRTGKKKAKYLTRAIRSGIVKTSINKTFKGHVIGKIISVLDENDYFLAAKLTYPPYAENIFPNSKPVVNKKGLEKYKDTRLHRFELTKSEEIYNFFDTLEKIGSMKPSLDENW